MKLLFIGDIVGSPGRNAVKELLPKLREQHALDFVIANGENSAGGNGITPKIAEELFSFGVDVITTGDHLWDQKEVVELLENEKRFLRPLNYPAGTPGQGSAIFEVRSSAFDVRCLIGVLNLQGRTFMPPLENPFLLGREEVERLRRQTKIIFVDFHAEATSEKIAMGWFLDGKVTAVVGTHTHVQTADDRVLPGGTAYITDVGMTGPFDSVIGTRKEIVLERFLTQIPNKFDVAKGDVRLQAVLIDVDERSGSAMSIERLSLPLHQPYG